MAAAAVSPESLERVLVRSLLQSFTDSLIECLRVPGARTPARLATWTKDTLELKLNLSLVAEAFLRLLASGLGALALVWATVVLLGGFSAMLGTMDFWFTTAVVFVETARIVGYNSAPEARFFVDVSAVLYQEEITEAGVSKFVWLLAMGLAWIALAPVFLATTCVSLSTIRLLGIAASARHSTSSSVTVRKVSTGSKGKKSKRTKKPNPKYHGPGWKT